MKLEQILTISARDYCEINAKQLSDYTAVGIHARLTFYDIKKGRYFDPYYENDTWEKSLISERIPPNTETVVCFKMCIIKAWYDQDRGENSVIYVSGTALIPKQKGEIK